MKLTQEQVESLAPDPGTLKRAQKIAKPSNYANIGASDRAIWAESLGSSNYTTYIDISGPAYKCSCPVKKLPCKHAMGLMVLIANQPELATAPEPEELTDWLIKRDSAAKAKETKKSGEVKDPKAQAKRQEQRTQNVEAGIIELRKFLEDMVRVGLAESSKRSQDLWQDMQKRLVDAQAKGLSGYLEWIRTEMGQGPQWTERVFRALVRLHAMLNAWDNKHNLSPAMVQQLRERIGWNQSKDDVLSNPAVPGPWFVINHGTKYESGLYSQTIWLMHQQTGQFAMALNFASDFNPEALEKGFQNGTLLPIASAHFYSQEFPQRIILKRSNAFEMEWVDCWDWLEQHSQHNFESAAQSLQKQRIQQPFLEYWPVLVKDVRIVNKDEQLTLADTDGRLLKIASDFTCQWQLLAVVGKNPVTMFMVTSDCISFSPWAVLNNGQWLALNMNSEL